MSDAFEFMKIMFHGSFKAVRYTKIGYSQAMYAAIRLAIKGGLRFEKDDFERFVKELGFYRWGGESEYLYAFAVKRGNVSCCQAYEKYRGRKPFRQIVDVPAENRQRNWELWSPGRLYVGRMFMYMNVLVAVTSFKSKDELIACETKEVKLEFGSRRVVTRRFRVTQDSLRDWVKELEKRFRPDVREVTDVDGMSEGEDV